MQPRAANACVKRSSQRSLSQVHEHEIINLVPKPKNYKNLVSKFREVGVGLGVGT